MQTAVANVGAKTKHASTQREQVLLSILVVGHLVFVFTVFYLSVNCNCHCCCSGPFRSRHKVGLTCLFLITRTVALTKVVLSSNF